MIVVCGQFDLGEAATYLVNDLSARRRDGLHPTKRAQPIASSAPRSGLAAGVLAAGVAVLWAAARSFTIPRC